MKHPRRRFTPPDLARYFHDMKTTEMQGFNVRRHETAHGTRKLVYTSATTLTTDAGARLYAPYNARIIAVTINVQGAGGTDTIGDLLVNGNSVFTAQAKPTVTAAGIYSKRVPCDNVSWLLGDYLTCKLTQTGGATGPAVFVIEILPGVST